MEPAIKKSETLAFATEPVLGSLANILSCLEDRLPQCLPPEVRDYQFLDIEIKYGLLQSVIVNKRGTWKLAGLEFTEKCNETDLLSPVSCQPFTSKLPKMGQPDLDYTAPEVQAASSCSPLSDMFSLGLIICSLFNGGRSIIEGNLSTTTYNKQLEVLEGSLHNMLDRVPHHLQEPLQGLLQVDPRRRPNAQNFSMIKYFMDPAVHGLQYLDVIQMKDSTHKSHFYHSLKTALPNIPKLEGSLHNMLDRVPHHLQEPLQGLLQVDPRRRPNAQNFSMIKYFMDPAVHGLQYLDVIQMKDSTHKSHFYHSLKTALPNIPKKLWWQHVLPSLKMELQSPEVLAAALQPLLFIIEESTVDEYQSIILPIFRSVFGMPKSVQATVTLLENLDVLMKKTPKTDIKADVLPMLYNSFDSTTPQIQCAAMHAIAQIADYLEESAVRKMVLPRTKQVFENNTGVKVQANALTCIEKIIDKLEKTDILDEVLPMLGKAKLQDPAILMPVVNVMWGHRHCRDEISNEPSHDAAVSETLAFATEPVLGSLANILSCLEDRLPQCLPPEVRDYQFLDIEIKYGLLQEASVFVFEKRVADKLHKPKRKETITEILRFSVRQLDRFKHPKLLTLYHPIEEAK
ncbi:SCY1-like protein 2 [Ixodes scapularis]